MKLKTIEINGSVYAEVQDGKPVYEAEDGKTVAFDAPYTNATIKRLNAEAKTHREAKEAAEAQLKAFADLDPEAARKALDTVRNLDGKKLIDAGEVEKLKAEIKEAYDRQFKTQYEPLLQERDQLRNRLQSEKLSVAFGQSKYLEENAASPRSLLRAEFGNRFSVGDDGRIAAKDPDGNPIYSRARPGEIADFEEAIAILIENHPDRDHILKGSGATGGGANGTRTGANGKRQVSRAAFEQMGPAERIKVSAEADIVD